MTIEPLTSSEQLPGNVRIQRLYRKLFRFEPIGPTLVVIVTIAGGIAGIAIWQPAWPLLALAIGGTGAAIWRIIVGDRSHAGDLVTWRYDQRSNEWAAMTGLPLPITSEAIATWTESAGFTRARAVDQARALIVTGDLGRAREALGRVNPKDNRDKATIAALRFDLEFTEQGEADFGPWADAVARIDTGRRREHRVSMAIFEAAIELANKGPWLIALDKMALELGPFEVTTQQRILRRVYPLVPVLLGIAILAIGTVVHVALAPA